MAVSPNKVAEVQARLKALGVLERDLSESFVRGSGRGGQKINKTNNCVYLIHEPSGVVVRCHREREREINRFLARRALCDELEFMKTGKRIDRKNGAGAKSATRNITITHRKQGQRKEADLDGPLPDISAFAEIYHLDEDGNQLS